jgi:hypothetical protein
LGWSDGWGKAARGRASIPKVSRPQDETEQVASVDFARGAMRLRDAFDRWGPVHHSFVIRHSNFGILVISLRPKIANQPAKELKKVKKKVLTFHRAPT